MTAKNTTKADQNSKIVRQISQVPHNKNCFDCGQKGPTYVNETIGAFVCTSCSGILRGLNPAQRVKSISMGTFADDEVKFIQLRGNAYCKGIWLWNYDPQVGPRPPETRDDQKMKDFLIAKYEKKRWYNASNELNIADQLKQSDYAGARSLGEDVSLSRKASASSQRSFRNVDARTRSSASPSIGSPSSNQRSSSSGNISLPRSHTSSAVNHFPETSELPNGSGNGVDDLFSVFGSVSISNPAPVAPADSSPSPFGADNWASFGRSQTMQSFQVASPHPVQTPAAQPALPARPLPAAFVPLQPAPAGSSVKAKPPAPTQTIAPSSASDKYAALAELDEMMHVSKPTSVPNNDGPPAAVAAWPNVATAPVNYPNPRAAQPAFSWGSPAGQPVALAAVENNPQHSWNDVFQTQPLANPGGYAESGAWGQFGYQSNGAATTNPFMTVAAPVVSHPVGQPQQRPCTHPTNPFL